MPCYNNILGYMCTYTQIYCSFILVHKPVLLKGKRNRILHNSDHKYAKICVHVLQYYDIIGKVLYVVKQTWTAYCVCVPVGCNMVTVGAPLRVLILCTSVWIKH